MEAVKNKVVVITGASAGVGRATAISFAREGARLALIAREENGLASIEQEAKELGAIARSYSADVSDATKIFSIVEEIEKDLGPINILVNNAMCSVFASFTQITPEEFKRVTEVTYLGQIYTTMAVLPKMYRRNQGTIILVGSALAHRGIPLQTPYCGAKHAVKGFFECLRCELYHNKSNIHLTIVHLPSMNTPQFDWVLNKLPHKGRPMGTIYQPEISAQAILFAAKNKRRSIYVGFPTYLAIIGNKFVPFILDRYLGRIGYKGQQTNEINDKTSQNNLWAPVKGLHSTHGRFNQQAHHKSFMLRLTMNRGKIFAVAVTILILMIVLIII